MEIRSLESTPLEEITRCFNAAFSDYFMEFTATENYLKTRWTVARVDYRLSFGCFIKGVLRGFIVHGIDQHNGQLTAHNCATGIEPPFRGKGLLSEIYQVAIPALRQRGVVFSTLEVITKNKRAIRGYEKNGFRIRPTLLHCFNGTPTISSDEIPGVEFRQKDRPDFKKCTPWLGYSPSWEMTEQALSTSPDNFVNHELHLHDDLIGFMVFSPKNSTIQQFAIHPNFRRQGFGQSMLKKICNDYPTIRINNVPETALSGVQFLNKIGMKNPIDQYEMEREIG